MYALAVAWVFSDLQVRGSLPALTLEQATFLPWASVSPPDLSGVPWMRLMLAHTRRVPFVRPEHRPSYRVCSPAGLTPAPWPGLLGRSRSTVGGPSSTPVLS